MDLLGRPCYIPLMSNLTTTTKGNKMSNRTPEKIIEDIHRCEDFISEVGAEARNEAVLYGDAVPQSGYQTAIHALTKLEAELKEATK